MYKVLISIIALFATFSLVGADYVDSNEVREDGYLYIKKISKNKVSYYLKVNEFQGCESNGLCNTASPNFKVVPRTVRLYNSKLSNIFKGKKQGDRLIVIGKKVYNNKGIYSGISYTNLYKIDDYIQNVLPYKKLETYSKWGKEIGEYYDGNGTAEINDFKIVNNGIEVINGEKVYVLSADYSNKDEIDQSKFWYHWDASVFDENNEYYSIDAIRTDDVSLAKIYVKADGQRKYIELNVGSEQAFQKRAWIMLDEK